MQIRADNLGTALARRREPLIWIHGDEPLLHQEAADQVRAHLRTLEFVERQVFTVDRFFKPDELQGQAGALSLFASRKLLEVRFTGKPTRDIGQCLGELAARAGDDIRLLVLSQRLDKQTSESAWFAAIDAKAVVVPIYTIDLAQLPAWIGTRLARQKQRADAATLSMIAERVEGNLLAAHQEIAKLGLLFPEGELPGDEVHSALLNVARYDSFDLANAMICADATRVLRTLDGLRAEGTPEPLVLWAVTDAIRNLLRLALATSDGQNSAQVMRELRIYGPRVRLFEQALRATPSRLLQARLTRALSLAADTDRIIKGVGSGDAWKSLEQLVLWVAGAPVPLMDETA